MNAIDEVKRRIDIVDLVESYGVRLKKVGSTYSGFCPFHDNRNTPALAVFPDTQSFYCFGCHAGGSVLDFVMHQEGFSFREALYHLAAQCGVEVGTAHEDTPDPHAALYECLNRAAFWFQVQLQQQAADSPVRQYLRTRDLTAQSIEAFGLGYAPQGSTGAFIAHMREGGVHPDTLESVGLLKRTQDNRLVLTMRGRLVFPIRKKTRQGATQCIAFGGRALHDDQQPKYLNTRNSPIFTKGESLYGLEQAERAIRRADDVVLVEGYLDVITAHQHGFCNVVAPLGTAVSAPHMQQLQRLADRIILAMDADAAGQRALLRAADLAEQAHTAQATPIVSADGQGRRKSCEVCVLPLPPGQDPDDLIRRDPDAWNALVAQPKALLDFRLDIVLEQYDMQVPAQRHKAIEAALPLIAHLPHQQAQVYADWLARQVDMPMHTITDLLRHTQPPRVERTESFEPVVQRPRQPDGIRLLALLFHLPHVAEWLEDQITQEQQKPPTEQQWYPLPVGDGTLGPVLQDETQRFVYAAWVDSGRPCLADEDDQQRWIAQHAISAEVLEAIRAVPISMAAQHNALLDGEWLVQRLNLQRLRAWLAETEALQYQSGAIYRWEIVTAALETLQKATMPGLVPQYKKDIRFSKRRVRRISKADAAAELAFAMGDTVDAEPCEPPAPEPAPAAPVWTPKPKPGTGAPVVGTC